MYRAPRDSYPEGITPPPPPHANVAGAFAEHYASAAELTARAIGNGALSADYDLPPASAFARQVDALQLFYDGLRGHGMKPRVGLVPQGLSTAQWNELLTGLSLKTRMAPNRQALSKGIALDHAGDLVLPVAESTAPRWDVAVMSVMSAPTFLTNAEGTGSHGGPQGTENNAYIRELPGIPEPQSPILADHIRNISPSFATYMAMQWHSMATEIEGPIDLGGATLLKERTTIDDEEHALYAGWYGGLQKVDCTWLGMDEARRIPITGIRPAMTAAELLPAAER